ncbi:Putative phage major head protein [Hyphomicrobiales bacterium]|nr:putative phage major head protein [Hyphomicrobiales bacterium]CAH1668550.1 Putative phage major head protein [Hyphomicrobiales bacterium]
MAVPSGTIQAVSRTKTIAEDVSNIITQIDPEETPFVSNIGEESVENSIYEWLVDNLNAATTANAAIDADDAPAPSSLAQLRANNYSQIFVKAVAVGGRYEAVKKYGMRSAMAYELAQRGSELKLDIEMTLLSNNTAYGGAANAASNTAGLMAWIRTNVNKNTAGVNPTLSGTTDGHPVTGRTASTARVFTEGMLKDVLQQQWVKGGKPKQIYMGAFNTGAAAAFPGLAQQQYQAPAGPTTIVGAASVYWSQWGKLTFVPSRLMPQGVVYTIDPSKVTRATLRGYQTFDLARTGDSTRKQLLYEGGLKVHNEAAHGIIADLTTA